MMGIIAFICSCFVVSACFALDIYLTGEPPKDEKAFYARIENDLKKEYEAVVASLTRKKSLTKAEQDKALDSGADACACGACAERNSGGLQ